MSDFGGSMPNPLLAAIQSKDIQEQKSSKQSRKRKMSNPNSSSDDKVKVIVTFDRKNIHFSRHDFEIFAERLNNLEPDCKTLSMFWRKGHGFVECTDQDTAEWIKTITHDWSIQVKEKCTFFQTVFASSDPPGRSFSNSS